jgi:NAD(P)-dependent dehydrogenase (short-subunit alcohol dehydrogenase family)
MEVAMEIRNVGVLVTGASRGLGLELSRALARGGAKVVMVARGARELENAVRVVKDDAATGGRGGDAHGLAFDVGEKEAVHRIAGTAAALVSPIEIVVHAASTLGPLPMPLLLDTECEDLQRVLDVNLVGPFRLTKALAGPMVLRQRGLVLFISSDAAINAYAGWGAYGVSKAAQDHLARTFAAELDPVRFFAVDPGEMDTKMHEGALPDADRTALAPPADVAARLVGLIMKAETLTNGARLAAADFAPYHGAGALR